jgi:hypothetical protein
MTINNLNDLPTKVFKKMLKEFIYFKNSNKELNYYMITPIINNNVEYKLSCELIKFIEKKK